MGMMINRRRYSGKKLPYDAEIEYLKSSGTQWINIEYRPQTASTIYIEGLFGVSSNENTRQFLFSDGVVVQHYIEFANMQYGGYAAYVSHTIKKGVLYQANALFTSTSVIYKIKIDDSEYSSSTSKYASSNWSTLRLFKLNNTYNSNGAIIGRCKINVNDTLVRDFIPVRVGTTGYMYDKVSGQLFGNAGTGAFILGPDKN